MNKKIRLLICASLLFSQLSPVTTVAGETEETVPAEKTETTEPSKETDNAVSPSETTESSSEENTSTKESKETNDSSEKASDSEGVKPAGGPTPFGTTLIEGVDIDAKFATLLREESITQDKGTAWSGYGKAQDHLTVSDMAALETINVSSKNLTSLKGIEYAPNLEVLICRQNNVTTVDLSNNPLLTRLDFYVNNLTSLDVSHNPLLSYLSVPGNNLTSLDVSNNPLLTVLNADVNPLISLDVSHNPLLTVLSFSNCPMTSIDVSHNPLLTELSFSNTQITDLDVSHNPDLFHLDCRRNKLVNLDMSNNPKLIYLNCEGNELTFLDVDSKPLLETLICTSNRIQTLNLSTNIGLVWLECQNNFSYMKTLDVTNCLLLEYLDCRQNNNLGTLDLSNNSLLTYVDCTSCGLTSSLDLSNRPNLTTVLCGQNYSISDVDVSDTPLLETLDCTNNQLTDLDLSNSPLLKKLTIDNNHFSNLNLISASANPLLEVLSCKQNEIVDITGATGLTSLTAFDASEQFINTGMPQIIGGNATVDVLKTSASTGLSLSNISIGGSPILTPNGDKIELGNVTYADLEFKALSFDFSGSDLTEGASSGSKSYSGNITFAPVSDLESQLVLEPEDEKKVESGGTVAWKWTIKSINPLKAENVYATLTLPSGLVIDPSSIKRNGVPASLSDIDGTTNLGDFAQGESITFEFTTTASGNANDWLKATGQLDWIDPNPKTKQVDESVQIKDDEQTYTPKTQEDMALLSVPESFRFGFWDMKNTEQTFSLHSSNYLTNTEVVTKGFYTRLRDDRNVSTGWKLSAQLSEFTDSSNNLMPNGSGSSLRMEDMTIENITDRDTPAEAINPSPIGMPSSVVTDETLVAGQTAKTLVSATSGEGVETWQLRIPFDKVSLNLPANAGQKNKNYSATLTWSLDDTP